LTVDSNFYYFGSFGSEVRALQLPKNWLEVNPRVSKVHCDSKRDCGVRSIIIYLVLCLLIYRGMWILYQAFNLCLLYVCQIHFSYCHDGVPSTSVLARCELVAHRLCEMTIMSLHVIQNFLQICYVVLLLAAAAEFK